jgi:hypothetical protein
MKAYPIVAAALLATAAATTVHAAEVVATLPDFDGPDRPDPTALPASVFTTSFTYSIPSNAVVTAAYLEGTYGTAIYDLSTAGFDAVVDGDQVTVCAGQDPGCWKDGTPLRAFSIALSSSIYSSLLSGTASLDVIETNPEYVRFGTPTLRIEYTTTPEPATWAMAVVGFAMAGAAMRRRRQVRFAF